MQRSGSEGTGAGTPGSEPPGTRLGAERETALVTGASSGLGGAFARALAARGYDLVVTARRADRLETLAQEIRERHAGTSVTTVALDLNEPDAARALHERTEGAGRPIAVLINNAGFANYGPFTELSWEALARELDLNVRALLELTWRFARSMRERDAGWILNVSSFVGWLPVPAYASYAAGKTFVRNFSEALAHELRGTGIHVLGLCPGGIRTEFWQVAGHHPRPIVLKTADSPERVAAIGLDALFHGRRTRITGKLNKLSAFLLRLYPRRLMPAAAASFSRSYEGE